MIGITPELGEKTLEVGEKTPEVGEKSGVSDDVKTGSVHVNPISDYVNHDFEVLMGAYRNDFVLMVSTRLTSILTEE